MNHTIFKIASHVIFDNWLCSTIWQLVMFNNLTIDYLQQFDNGYLQHFDNWLFSTIWQLVIFNNLTIDYLHQFDNQLSLTISYTHKLASTRLSKLHFLHILKYLFDYLFRNWLVINDKLFSKLHIFLIKTGRSYMYITQLARTKKFCFNRRLDRQPYQLIIRQPRSS